MSTTVKLLSVDAFKVVRTDAVTRRDGTVQSVRSALLNSTSKALTEYKPVTVNPQRIYTHPALDGTPHIAFETLAAARAFVRQSEADNGHTGYKIHKLHGLCRFVLPVTTVLRLNTGWADKAKAFWNAYVTGQDLGAFDTQPAPDGSIAIFGMVNLGDQVS